MHNKFLWASLGGKQDKKDGHLKIKGRKSSKVSNHRIIFIHSHYKVQKNMIINKLLLLMRLPKIHYFKIALGSFTLL